MVNHRVMTVAGMTCDGCERRISSAVSAVDGVNDVVADHMAGTVTIEIVPDLVDMAAVHDAIENLGYKLETR